MIKLTKQLDKLIDNLKSQQWIKSLTLSYHMYIVGGCVRDGFLEKPIKDIDIVVENISIDKLIDFLKNYGKVDLVGESFSVIKFKPLDDYDGECFDIAVPRKDRKTGDGHKGFEVVTENISIIDDLRRRDITINSIAINILTKELLDPFNGLKDLKNKTIRATDPTAFIEDPLRLFRIVQFSSRFNFRVEPITKSLMKENAHLINEISGERILEEFEKIINKHGKISTAMQLMYDTNIDFHLFEHKFFNVRFKIFDGYDKLSFYYLMLGFANVLPSRFYSERLKGNSDMTKALSTLETIETFEADKGCNNDDKNRLFIMKMIKSSSLILESKWFINKESKILNLMEMGKIPMYFGDVNFTGDDIIRLKPSLKGKEIGEIYDKMYEHALVNNYNWKNRIACLDYLMKIL